MSSISVNRHVQTPRESVWSVLADFANIADWNSGVTESFSTSEAAEGVGATRHCDLKPLGALEETIAGWEPMREMVVRIDSAAKLPIKTALVTFTLDGDDSAPTVTIVYDYVPKFGPLGRVIEARRDVKGARGGVVDG
jgi:uncharacterized protein YndB with AHSA1/START domain